MDAQNVESIAFGFVVVWSLVVLAHALWMGRYRSWDPAPPEEPDHHDH